MPERVRIGFIGAGGIARHHLRQLQEIDEAEVVAFADPSADSLAKVVEQYPQYADTPTFSDYHDMLASVPMDAVEIHTPHTQHYQQALDVFQAGKHLLLEKPMVCTVPHAHDLIEAAGDLVFMVSYQRRFQGSYVYIRDQVRAGALGEIQYVSLLMGQDWLRSQRGKWRQVMDLSGGGQLNDSGSHIVDVMLWTTGLQAESVMAYCQNYDTEVDVDSALAIRFTNSALGTISIIGDCPMFYEEFSIFGSEGAMLQRHGELTLHRFGVRQPEAIETPASEGNPDRNFVDAILGRDEVRVPPECGLRVIELTEAAWKSAELGRRVNVDELR
ncbi:MAG: Gfo/Idh/MocA family protein [Anaerolineae bacterium]